MIDRAAESAPNRARATGLRQCHDITVYPAHRSRGRRVRGLRLPARHHAIRSTPVRLDAVADSNFSYWHSATFNNDGTKMLFSDEWGGGGAPKCRATDPKEWGADAIFTIENGKLEFQSYYKMPAPQTDKENCVAHNGSLIPIPGRDVMVQAWYQGGISVFDWTDAAHPKEIAYFDRGPVDSTRIGNGGSWSAYWYNGTIVSSEIARGLDVVELTPSAVHLAERDRCGEDGALGLPQRAGPAEVRVAADLRAGAGVRRSARAEQVPLVDRANGAVRQTIAQAEGLSGTARRDALWKVASSLDADRGSRC